MKTLTPIEAHEKIVAAGKINTPETRVVKAIETGEWVRQGDIMVVRIPTITKGWHTTTERQLAPGTTQGSRHVAVGKVTVFRSPDARPIERCPDGRIRLLGPQITAPGRLIIEHPEHAHMDLPPGDYQVSFQTDIRTQNAVRD